MDLLQQGISSYLDGDVNDAIKSLSLYLKSTERPDDQGYYYLGLAYQDIGKLTEAGEYFQKALEIKPEKATYQYRLGLVYAGLMLFGQAIKHLEFAVKSNPEHVRAIFMLGTIYFKNGDLQKAAALFDRVTVISPEFPTAYYQKGLCHYYLGDTAAAVDSFKKVLEFEPNHTEANTKLGHIYASDKKYAEALGYMQKAYENNKEMTFLCHYAYTLLTMGDKKNAAEVLHSAQELYPNSSEVKKIAKLVKLG